jgi:hypothetical protein
LLNLFFAILVLLVEIGKIFETISVEELLFFEMKHQYLEVNDSLFAGFDFFEKQTEIEVILHR